MFRWFSRSAPRIPAERKYPRPQVETLEQRVVPTLGGQFTVQGINNQSETQPAVAIAGANGVTTAVVVWTTTTANDGLDVRARVAFNRASPPASATGTFGTFFDVSDSVGIATQDADQASVAVAPNGNYVVVWRNTFNQNQDIYYAFYRLGATGAAESGIVAGSATLDETDARVAMSGRFDNRGRFIGGGFVITYSVQDAPTTVRKGNPPVTSDIVMAKVFDPNGLEKSQFTVANRAKQNRDVANSRITMNEKGKFAVSYLEAPVNTPLTRQKLYLQRYSIAKSGLTAKFQGKTTVYKAAKPSRNGAIFSQDISMDNKGNTTVVYNEQQFRKTVGAITQVIHQRTIKSTGVRGSEQDLVDSFLFGATLADVSVATNPISQNAIVTFHAGSQSYVQAFLKNGDPDLSQPEGTGAISLNGSNNSSNSAIAIDALNNYFVAYEVPSGLSDVVARLGILPPPP